MGKLRVSKATYVKSLAGAIAANIRKDGEVDITLVGPNALNQAIKSIVVARRFLQNDENKSDISILPDFLYEVVNDRIEGEREITSIILHVKKIDYKEENKINFYNNKHKDILTSEIKIEENEN